MLHKEINRKRVCRAVFTAVFLYIVLSFDLAADRPASIYDRITKALHTYGLNGTIVTLGFTAFLYLWFQRTDDRLFSYNPVISVISVPFALLNTAALYLFYRDMLPESLPGIFIFLLLSAGWAVIFILLSSGILYFFQCVSRPADISCENGSASSFFQHHIFAVSFAVIIIAWLPWLISYYPASMEWDVYDPIRRFLGERPPSNHHPWFYACVIGSAYKLGLWLGDKNIGVFIYILIRALIMAAVYARCVALQRKYETPQWVQVLTVLFFSVVPIWGAYAKHAFKDTIGAALFCWYIISTIDILYCLRKGSLPLNRCLEHCIAGLFASLFRNNMIYVVLPTTIVLSIIVLFQKQHRKKAALLICGLLLYQAYQYYIFNVANVEPGSVREALSIPFQQTARTVRDHADSITEEERLIISSVLDYDNLADSYDPIISDPVKNREHGDDETRMQYLKTWAEMFFKYPRSYLEAFIAHSSGYYAFTPEYTDIQGNGPGSRHANIGMTVFNWVEDPRFDSELTCRYVPQLSGLRAFLDNVVKIWHQIPILNLTDTKALYTWSLVLLGVVVVSRKEYDKLLPVFACLLMVLTCVASPVNDCFRYYCPVAAAFPATLVLARPYEGHHRG